MSEVPREGGVTLTIPSLGIVLRQEGDQVTVVGEEGPHKLAFDLWALGGVIDVVRPTPTSPPFPRRTASSEPEFLERLQAHLKRSYDIDSDLQGEG